MYHIENYDYKILNFVCKSNEPVRMCDIYAKFDIAGRTAAIQMSRDGLLFWDYSDADPFSHDDSCTVTATDRGRLVWQRYVYNKQLKTKELWANRIVSYILGILSSVAVYCITECLLPLIDK